MTARAETPLKPANPARYPASGGAISRQLTAITPRITQLGLFCCAGIIAYDIAVNQRRQPMGVMNFVFPITALYFGPFALALYWRWGRAPAQAAPTPANLVSQAATADAGGSLQARGGQNAHHDMPGAAGPGGADEAAPPGARARPWWVTMAIEVSHCGSGCSLGDVISEFAIFWLALTIAGSTLGAEYAGDYVLALGFGIVFQYFAIAPMRGLGLRDGLAAAAKADFISWSANVWLVNRGIKTPM
jgi:Domain of unknown function (DUF4396)